MRDATGTAMSVRDRLVDAAFDLFAEQGYEQTTVEHIVERAGVGRTTFFRQYKSKEDVIFPDHDRLIAAIRDRLATSTDQTALVAVSEAVRLVLRSYVAEGDRARQRYLLTSTIPILNDRETASVARYQRLFREFIAEWLRPTPDASLRSELMAAAVVAAHNHVLRRWLRNDGDDPLGELDAAMVRVIDLFTGKPFITTDGGSTVIVLSSSRDPEHTAEAIRHALQSGITKDG